MTLPSGREPRKSAPGMTPGELPPARTMADIARIFLDGARPTPANGPVKRVGPQERSASVQAVAPASPLTVAPSDVAASRINIESPKAAPEVEPAPPKTRVELPPVMLALTGKESPVHAQRLLAAADSVAREHDVPVCVVTVQNGYFTLDFAGVASVADLPAVHFAGGSPDLQIAHTLFTFRHVAKHWIIASPDPDNAAFVRIAAAVPDWLLVTATDNDSVISAYQQFKRAIALSVPSTPPMAVLLSNDYSEAKLIHSRLRRAAKEFLTSELPLLSVAANSSVSALRLASIAVGEVSDLWPTILDELCGSSLDDGEEEAPVELPGPMSLDLDEAISQAASAMDEVNENVASSAKAEMAAIEGLANVLDPEEREALSEGLFEEKVVAAATEAVAQEPIAQVAEASAPKAIENLKSEISDQGFLPAVELAGESLPTRAWQWAAVERSISDLTRGTLLLDARPPMSWAKESCLAVDTDGKLHIWTLYKDGVSWFALREWANEHRNILALTRRDLTIDTQSLVSIHIVLPAERPSEDPASTLLKTQPEGVTLYRLRLIMLSGQKAAAVVPIA